MITLGFREDFKEEEREKEKEEKEKDKEDQDEDFSDQETKEKEKEREKEKVILLKMKAIGLKMNGKEMKQRLGMKAIEPMKMKQHGNPKAGMNGKESMVSMDTSKEKERKERKEKGKGKKGHGPQDQGKGQGDGKGAANYVNPFFSKPRSASSSTFVLECLRILCDTFTCVLDISHDDREWRA